MFRLKSCGLPKDPVFPNNLPDLGYFINSDDEIRNIQRPNEYFKYFLTQNERYNIVQREAMNTAIRDIIQTRLHALNLQTIRLPLGAAASDPHIPIYVSKNIHQSSRVMVLFYEHTQDLGVFAQRIIGGAGGINKGSAINFVKYVQSLPSSPSAPQSPGIILANLGQLRWYRRGARAISQASWFALPRKSAVYGSPRFDPIKNTVPGHRDTAEHVDYVLNTVVGMMVPNNAKIDIIAVSDGAIKIVDFFDSETHFAKWEDRLGGMALVAPFHQKEHLKNDNFREWLYKRGRAYTTSQEPIGVPIDDGGSDKSVLGFGCNAYSLGELFYNEMLLPRGYKVIVDYFLEVASGEDYCNPRVLIIKPDEDRGEDNDTWATTNVGRGDGVAEELGSESNVVAEQASNLSGARAEAADVRTVRENFEEIFLSKDDMTAFATGESQ